MSGNVSGQMLVIQDYMWAVRPYLSLTVSVRSQDSGLKASATNRSGSSWDLRDQEPGITYALRVIPVVGGPWLHNFFTFRRHLHFLSLLVPRYGYKNVSKRKKTHSTNT